MFTFLLSPTSLLASAIYELNIIQFQLNTQASGLRRPRWVFTTCYTSDLALAKSCLICSWASVTWQSSVFASRACTSP